MPPYLKSGAALGVLLMRFLLFIGTFHRMMLMERSGLGLDSTCRILQDQSTKGNEPIHG